MRCFAVLVSAVILDHADRHDPPVEGARVKTAPALDLHDVQVGEVAGDPLVLVLVSAERVPTRRTTNIHKTWKFQHAAASIVDKTTNEPVTSLLWHWTKEDWGNPVWNVPRNFGEFKKGANQQLDVVLRVATTRTKAADHPDKIADVAKVSLNLDDVLSWPAGEPRTMDLTLLSDFGPLKFRSRKSRTAKARDRLAQWASRMRSRLTSRSTGSDSSGGDADLSEAATAKVRSPPTARTTLANRLAPGASVPAPRVTLMRLDATTMPREKTVFLVRHGESTWNEAQAATGAAGAAKFALMAAKEVNNPLSVAGGLDCCHKATVEGVAPALAEATLLVVSPLKRALQTALIFLASRMENLGTPALVLLRNARERKNPGGQDSVGDKEGEELILDTMNDMRVVLNELDDENRAKTGRGKINETMITPDDTAEALTKRLAEFSDSLRKTCEVVQSASEAAKQDVASWTMARGGPDTVLTDVAEQEEYRGSFVKPVEEEWAKQFRRLPHFNNMLRPNMTTADRLQAWVAAAQNVPGRQLALKEVGRLHEEFKRENVERLQHTPRSSSIGVDSRARVKLAANALSDVAVHRAKVAARNLFLMPEPVAAEVASLGLSDDSGPAAALKAAGDRAERLDGRLVQANDAVGHWWLDTSDKEHEGPMVERMRDLAETLLLSEHEKIALVGHSHFFRAFVQAFSPNEPSPLEPFKQCKLRNGQVVAMTLGWDAHGAPEVRAMAPVGERGVLDADGHTHLQAFDPATNAFVPVDSKEEACAWPEARPELEARSVRVAAEGPVRHEAPVDKGHGVARSVGGVAHGVAKVLDAVARI